MTIRITLLKDGKNTRREYKTHARAISALGNWFKNNRGMALINLEKSLSSIRTNMSCPF